MRREVKRFEKKFPHFGDDLRDLAKQIEKDHKTASNCFCVPMPDKPHLQDKVWKYDVKSSDLRKHPRDSFRLIGVLSDHPDDKIPTMYVILVYLKAEVSNKKSGEIARAYKDLMEHLAQVAAGVGDSGDDASE